MPLKPIATLPKGKAATQMESAELTLMRGFPQETHTACAVPADSETDVESFFPIEIRLKASSKNKTGHLKPKLEHPNKAPFLSTWPCPCKGASMYSFDIISGTSLCSCSPVNKALKTTADEPGAAREW